MVRVKFNFIDGQGVDIPAANRVVIFDIHWNPAVDEQGWTKSLTMSCKPPTF